MANFSRAVSSISRCWLGSDWPHLCQFLSRTYPPPFDVLYPNLISQFLCFLPFPPRDDPPSFLLSLALGRVSACAGRRTSRVRGLRLVWISSFFLRLAVAASVWSVPHPLQLCLHKSTVLPFRVVCPWFFVLRIFVFVVFASTYRDLWFLVFACSVLHWNVKFPPGSQVWQPKEPCNSVQTFLITRNTSNSAKQLKNNTKHTAHQSHKRQRRLFCSLRLSCPTEPTAAKVTGLVLPALQSTV